MMKAVVIPNSIPSNQDTANGITYLPMYMASLL